MGFLGTVGIHSRGNISAEQVMREIRKNPSSAKAGAIATFIGIVREEPVEPSSSRVQYLKYEAFKEVAVQTLQELRDVSIHHVVDRVGAGDESLIIVALGTRRKFVFPVLEEVVGRVKKEIPILKKEVTSEKAYWVENMMSQHDSIDHG